VFINLLFKNTVSSLCYAIIENKQLLESNPNFFPHNQVVNFVLKQHQNMPDYLRLPILILTVGLNSYSFFQKGKLLTFISTDLRCQYLDQWKQSSLSPLRDLMRFYESLTVFAWYSNLE
jgi:hypothetical protein